MRAGPRLRARSGGLRVYLSACIPVTPTPTDPFRKHMQRTPIESIPKLPAQLRQYTAGRRLYDSSSSPEARVYALSGGSRENARPDLFLKTAAAGTLAHEARMDDTFHMLGLGPEVVEYLPGSESQADWLLTRAFRGEDCTAQQYLDDPKRLCDTSASRLRELHELPRTKHEQIATLTIPDVLADYLANAEHGMHTGRFDAQFCGLSQSDARRVIAEGAGTLHSDALIHGDYCLPNIMLDDWRLSGFIDLDHAGFSDRHIDIFWGIWTLQFNLHTDAYRNRFLDVYGRDRVNQARTDQQILGVPVLLLQSHEVAAHDRRTVHAAHAHGGEHCRPSQSHRLLRHVPARQPAARPADPAVPGAALVEGAASGGVGVPSAV